MGNQSSNIDPVHLRMYSNMIQIQDPVKRCQVIQTCFASIEYVNSAKRTGIYSYLLQYLSIIQSGGNPPLLPGEQHASYTSSSSSQQVPRSMQQQQPFIHPSSGIGATHPSLLNAPNSSMYLTQSQTQQNYQQNMNSTQQKNQIIAHSDSTPSWKVITDTPKQKAMTYFSSCLEVLGIQEEVALTDESLKKAYKRTAIKAHPDKGGSEEYFEAVTRAYAYLTEILKHMKGGKKENYSGTVQSSQSVHSQRDRDAKQWEYSGEPVRLNAKNLDMNAFNKLFQENHLPDPDSDGYGDWLKTNDSSSAASSLKFKGGFNRDVFNRMFDEESKKSSHDRSSQLMIHPGEMALTLNPTSGVDLVIDRPSSFTAAPNSKMQFTDLRGAYTSESTISDKVSNVQVKERNLEQYRASREKAPDPFNQSELHSIREFEQRQSHQEQLRERKKAEMSVRNQDFFDQMKRRVITDGAVDLNQGKLGY
jgi:curved DNA-binding protein CbpA